MKPIINLEDPPDRVVGRRTAVADSLSVRRANKQDARAWSKAFPVLHIKRGVYRFNTHEEADEWLWKRITQRPRS